MNIISVFDGTPFILSVWLRDHTVFSYSNVLFFLYFVMNVTFFMM